MKVIGAGFGRTGTMSLKAALERLGFGPCYHMTEVFGNPDHVAFWEAAWRGEPVDWDGFFAGYGAAVDWPACAFYGELMRRYPEARVLLSVRDPEKWYESALTTIYEIRRFTAGSRFLRVAFAAAGLFVPNLTRIGYMTDEIIWRGTFDDDFEDHRHAVAVFERHNEEVRRRVPPDRLLVYEVNQGWGPLCDFLGVPEPEEPFPHLNDAAEMRRRIRLLTAVSVAMPAALAALALLLAAAVIMVSRRTEH